MIFLTRQKTKQKYSISKLSSAFSVAVTGHGKTFLSAGASYQVLAREHIFEVSLENLRVAYEESSELVGENLILYRKFPRTDELQRDKKLEWRELEPFASGKPYPCFLVFFNISAGRFLG